VSVPQLDAVGGVDVDIGAVAVVLELHVPM
jgi:hypothetical protein